MKKDLRARQAGRLKGFHIFQQGFDHLGGFDAGDAFFLEADEPGVQAGA